MVCTENCIHPRIQVLAGVVNTMSTAKNPGISVGGHHAESCAEWQRLSLESGKATAGKERNALLDRPVRFARLSEDVERRGHEIVKKVNSAKPKVRMLHTT